MAVFEQDDLEFQFPDDCLVLPAFDEQSFYKRLCGSQVFQAKGCDILAIYQDDTLYLIEAKDYAHAHPAKVREKPSDLAVTIAKKAFDTLAGLVVGAHHSSDEEVREFCRHALTCSQLCVVATVELARNPKALSGKDALYRRNLKEQLKRNVKELGKPHVIVTWNHDSTNKHKFWSSCWALGHD